VDKEMQKRSKESISEENNRKVQHLKRQYLNH